MYLSSHLCSAGLGLTDCSQLTGPEVLGPPGLHLAMLGGSRGAGIRPRSAQAVLSLFFPVFPHTSFCCFWGHVCLATMLPSLAMCSLSFIPISVGLRLNSWIWGCGPSAQITQRDLGPSRNEGTRAMNSDHTTQTHPLEIWRLWYEAPVGQTSYISSL